MHSSNDGGVVRGGKSAVQYSSSFFFFQLHNRITSCSRRESTEGTFSEQISEKVKSAAGQSAAESRSARTNVHGQSALLSVCR